MKLLATTKMGNFPVKIYESTETKSYQAYGITRKTEDGQELHIQIDPEMSRDLYWETFWHEFGHVFEQAYGIKLDHGFVNILGMALSQYLGNMKWSGKPAVKLSSGLEITKQLRKKSGRHRRK